MPIHGDHERFVGSFRVFVLAGNTSLRAATGAPRVIGAAGKGSSVRQRMGERFREVFGADLRSIAALRVALAVLVLVDLAVRATDLTAHYTDAGVLPRSAVVENPGLLSPYSFSLNLMGGIMPFQALLFGAAALAALAMLVGYRTRPATLVVWLMVLSIHHRNMLAINGGDILLQLLLFWSLFLPLGATWSVDRARSTARPDAPGLSTRFFSAATVAFIMQIALMYWFTALLKTGDDWRVTGDAIFYALSNDQLSTRIGSYLLDFPALLQALTFGTLAFEALGPFLLFCPFFFGPTRTAVVAAFVGLHVGIWTTMEVGLFPFISALCMVFFLPAWFWDSFLPKIPGLGAIGRRLQPPGTRSSVSNPTDDQGADETAGTRPVVLRSSPVVNLAALFFLCYVFAWNVTTVTPVSMPAPAYPIGPFLGVYQNWVMFAPDPPKDDGWWVVPGELRGGREVDLMSVVRDDYGLRGVSYEKPDSVIATYNNNEHWHKYLEYITTLEYTETPEELSQLRADQREQRGNFAGYLCRAWNERHAGDETLEDLRIIYMREETPADRRPAGKAEKVVLQEHGCS